MNEEKTPEEIKEEINNLLFNVVGMTYNTDKALKLVKKIKETKEDKEDG